VRFRWLYTGVRVLDLARAKRFYVQGLGMRVRFQFHIKETGGRIVELVSGDGRHFLELNWYPEGSAHATPYAPGEALDHLAFRIGDASMAEAIAHLQEHWGTLRIAPFEEGDCVLAYVDSPDGHTIELDAHHQAKKAKAKRAAEAAAERKAPKPQAAARPKARAGRTTG
jgi:catechol 2,3-dioxygenase-like lactoylglutathione lyase family enzyme